MAFQKNVEIELAKGVPGASASINPFVSPALGRIAKENCPVGGFVWDDDETEGTVKPSGSGKPLGFVHRDVIYPIVTVTAEAQEYVPAGCAVDVAVKGDFYAVCEGAKKGDAVCADASTGAVATSGEATDFVFACDADEAGLVIISVGTAAEAE